MGGECGVEVSRVSIMYDKGRFGVEVLEQYVCMIREVLDPLLVLGRGVGWVEVVYVCSSYV